MYINLFCDLSIFCSSYGGYVQLEIHIGESVLCLLSRKSEIVRVLFILLPWGRIKVILYPLCLYMCVSIAIEAKDEGSSQKMVNDEAAAINSSSRPALSAVWGSA